VSTQAQAQAAGRVEAHPGFVRVHFADRSAGHADFHYFWLRHNCDCCRHPLTGERTICSSSVALDVTPAQVEVDRAAGGVRIAWQEDGGRHVSLYRFDWLAAHAYARNRADVPPPPGDAALLEVEPRQPHPLATLAACLERVRARGAAVVRGAGTDTEALIDGFARAGLAIIATHFGRIEDLRTDNTTNRNTDQLGYTDAPVDLHTDQPFLEEPPRYQMLHCMRPADTGGESYLADGRQAALYLKSVDARAFELLTTVPVRFHRVQKEFERLEVSPIVELRDGEVFRIRSSYFTMAPHRLPFERMAEWYGAYNRFVGIVSAPAHQFRFRLEAGDFLMYDNFRMLHARTAFRGARWVRGVYFDPGSEGLASG
jgi:gamma-butyrobetaine dioxygenase/trimethyllysine dioxygenase